MLRLFRMNSDFGDLKMDDNRFLRGAARDSSITGAGGIHTFSAYPYTNITQASSKRPPAKPASPLSSEPVSLVCKGVFTPCCNTLDPEKFCRQCALLCALAPNAEEVQQDLHSLPQLVELAKCLPERVVQQHAGFFLIRKDIELVECDSRAQSFFASAGVFKVKERDVHCAHTTVHKHFVEAARATLKTGALNYVLAYAPNLPQKRFCLVTFRVSLDQFPEFRDEKLTLVLIQPLDARRVATAQQLMHLFGLSAAEARLARALAHGETLEYYVAAQGIHIATARCQLRSAFAKTATGRQAELVRLVLGVPPIR